MSEEKRLAPLGEWLIVAAMKRAEEMSKGGIVLPVYGEQKHEEKLLAGKVIAAGPGKLLEPTNNAGFTLKPMTCKIGDMVLYSKYEKGTIETERIHNVKDSHVVAKLVTIPEAKGDA